MINKSYLIELGNIKSEQNGYLTIIENSNKIPFIVKRLFWTFQIPDNSVRGNHAHFKTEQVLIALNGEIKVRVEYPSSITEYYSLDHPSKALYLPPNVWHTMEYTNNAIQLVLASSVFDESDYIREYENYKKIYSE